MYIHDIENYEIMSGKKFRGKYRIDSARMKNYDYSRNGAYFVTIVTKNRENYFGEIVDKKMQLFEMGKIAEKFWHEIPQHFPFVKLDAFVVMPNHVHGIIWIDNDERINNGMYMDGTRMDGTRRDAINRVSTTGEKQNGGITGKNNPMFHKNLSRIIRWYKGRCTFEINKLEKYYGFAWQSRFHDHIIRDETAITKIREYIILNPELWERDRNNNANW